MSEPFVPVNQQDVVDYYINNTAAKVPDVAAHFSLKPQQVSAILSLHGVTVRRGAHNLTDAARAAGLATRKDKALTRRLTALVQEYGATTVNNAFNDVLVATLSIDENVDAG
jgi:hypothetical protein